jgi:phage protein D
MSIKSPYYKVYIGDRDITRYVESITYEDATEEDNIITLKIDQDYALQLADDPDFVTGKIIAFQFGFMGGAVSQLHKSKVTDIKHTYRERVMMTMKCLDLGTTVKKTTSQKIWENKTSSQIAEAIASKYGFDKEIKTTSKVWENLPQGNKSDLEFLKYIAAREGQGNLVVFIRNNTLYFVERGLKEDSKVTFTYGYGDGEMVSFEPTQKESTKKAVSNQTAITKVDEKTGKVTTTVVDNTTEEDTGSTELYKFDADNGDNLGEISEDNTTVGKQNSEPVENEEEAKSLANSTKKNAALEGMTAKLKLDGQPLLVPNSVITIKNVAKRHLGNWLITKVTHSIQSGAYITTCDLKRNASKSKTKNKSKDANTTEGGDKIKDEVKLPVNIYDAGTGKSVEVISENNTTVKKK